LNPAAGAFFFICPLQHVEGTGVEMTD